MDPAGLIDGLTGPDASPRDQHRLLSAARNALTSWALGTPKTIASFVRQVLERVTLGQDEIEIQISKKALKAALLGSPPASHAAAPDQKTPESDALILKLPACLKRCSGEIRLVIPAGVQPDLRPRPNAALIKALSRAHTWKETLLSGQAGSICDICNNYFARKVNQPALPREGFDEYGVLARSIRRRTQSQTVAVARRCCAATTIF